MELRQLRYFRAAVLDGHVTRAAQRLGITQPALSAAIRKLETELGVELLHRTGRGVEPTQAGRALLEHAERTLRSADDAVAAIRALLGLERGSISVGAGATATGYLLPEAVRTFRERHPAIRFFVREASSAAVASSVLAGTLDLGIVTLPVGVPGASDLLTLAEIDDELRLLVPPGHALAGRSTFRWPELAGEPVIGFEAGSAVRTLLDDAARAHGVDLHVVMELRSIEAIKRMIAASIGVGFASRFALPPGDGLRCRDGRISRTLGVVRRRDRVPGPAAQAFERLLLATLARD